jgi:hypothetical protein
MKIPDITYKHIKETLWSAADRLGWPTLSDQQKSAQYEKWLRDPEIGRVLSRYLDPGNVRVYIKDTVMKPYGRERIKPFSPILKALGLAEGLKAVETYTKPHGRRLADGKVICWGLARDWKTILLAVFERAYLVRGSTPFGAVLLFPVGKYQQPVYRQMIEIAARKMEITKMVWYDVLSRD